MSIKFDEELVKEYLSGDEKALELLIQRYLNRIYAFVFKYLRSDAEADDLTQEIFVKVWKKLKTFNNSYKFKTWLYSIAKNAALDYLKKKNRPILFSDLDNAEDGILFSDSLVDKSPSALEQMETREGVNALNFAVEKLSPDYRKALDLRFNQDLKFKDMAEILKEPIDTVKTRCRRAVDQLKKLISGK